MNAKTYLLAAAMLLCTSAPLTAHQTLSPRTELPAPTTPQSVLKAASLAFQQIGYDYSYELLNKEYVYGNVTIEELPNNSFRVSYGGNEVIIVLEEIA